MMTLVLGGSRSGKSAFAESLAAGLGQPVCYVATALAFDDEMRHRIAAHQARRPAGWTTVDASLDISNAVLESRQSVILVDSLTVWAGNLLLEVGEPPEFGTVARVLDGALQQIDEVVRASSGDGRHLIVVSDEVGSGVVPPYPLGRVFRDLLGSINQRAAAAADRVFLVVAGIPLDLRALGWRGGPLGTS